MNTSKPYLTLLSYHNETLLTMVSEVMVLAQQTFDQVQNLDNARCLSLNNGNDSFDIVPLVTTPTTIGSWNRQQDIDDQLTPP